MRAFLRVLWRGWMRFAHFVALVNTWILLTAVFFVILTPLALVRRVILRLRVKPNPAASSWQARNHTFTAGDLEKMW